MSSILRFGLVYGLVLVIAFYISHLVLGTSPDNFVLGEVVGYSVMIISSMAVVIGIKEYKLRRAPAPLGFIGGLGAGLGISLIASHIFALYNWVYLQFINPNFTATYVQYSELQIRSSGLEPAVIERQLAELAHYAELMNNNFTQSMVMFVTVFMIGTLFSFISALVLRTPRK